MKLTDSDMLSNEKMLTEVVKRGKIKYHKARLLGVRHCSVIDNDYYIKVEYLDGLFRREKNITLPDLIADHEFMKAVWKGWTCLACNGKKTEKILGFDSSMKNIARVWCNDCNGYVDVINTNTYHALEALKLLHDTEGNAIKYLYDNLLNVK